MAGYGCCMAVLFQYIIMEIINVGEVNNWN